MATEGRKRHLSGTTNILDFPVDVLLLIVNGLNHNERLNLSLVSKSFRSLTSSFVKQLNFTRIPSSYAFRKLLARFSSATRIGASSKQIVRVLNAVAKSGLKIERLEIWGGTDFPKMDKYVSLSGKFGAVKALKLDFLDFAHEAEVVEFIHLLFPSLEDLETCFCSTLSDFGIEKLVHKPLNLRRISLGLLSSTKLTDRGLDVLTNCVNLEHISLNSWGGDNYTRLLHIITHNKKSLKSLELPDNQALIERDDLLQLAETISHCENLSNLKINHHLVKDDFLRIIASSHSPLKSLEFLDGKHSSLTSLKFLDGNCGYTLTGMSAMLLAFQGLTKLHVCTPWSADTEMSQVVKPLPHLKELYLSSRFAAYKTLFSLIQNCPLLDLVHVKFPIGDHHYEDDLPREIKKNFSVQCIILYPEPVDAVKIALKLVCPCLKELEFPSMRPHNFY